MYIGGSMSAVKTAPQRLINSETFISQYRSGRRDFTRSDIKGQKFEICYDGVKVRPIVFENVDLANSNLKKVIFNSVIFKNSRLAGCDMEEIKFVNCTFENVDANVSSFINGNIYNAEIKKLDIRYSNLYLLDVEISKIFPRGLILGKNNLSTMGLFAESCNNTGLENIVLDKLVFASHRQYTEMMKKGLDIDKIAVSCIDDLVPLNRIKKIDVYEMY